MAKKKPEADKLPLREELFVAGFVAHGNATRAAESAGYSKRTAYAKGCELLKRPRVAQAIQAAKTRITKKFKVTAERVVEEMALIGFSDVRHYAMSEDGFITLADGAPDSAMRAVKKIKRKWRSIPQKDGDPIIEIDTEFELWNKDTELRSLGDYLAIFKENRAVDEPDENDQLTPAQRRERVVAILRTAARRRKQVAGVKR